MGDNMEVMNINKYRHARHSFFQWQNELEFSRRVILAIGFACLTGLLAQIRFFLPNNPIPFTGQVFGVLLAGVILGSRFGTLSQGMYVGFGAAGMPWFSGMTGGFSYLAGYTGGFLIGFIVAAWLIGLATERYVKARSFPALLGLMSLGIGVIYLFGATWFGLVSGFDLGTVIAFAVAPFIVVDIIKAAAAAAIGVSITTKKGYGKELDA